MKSYQQIRCQRCRAANPLGEELCGQCGTRLMLVSEPSALRFEEEALAEQPEGLVTERLSLLEHNLTRVIGSLERSTKLMTQQAQIVAREHGLLEGLISLLSDKGLIDLAELRRLWAENCARESESAEQTKLLGEVRGYIVQAYRGRAPREFVQLVDEGFAALDKEDYDDAWRLLERAAALAPTNAPLNALLGRQYFRAGKLAVARSYLERAFASAPKDGGTCLLLALIRGDEGDAAGAFELLAEAERLGEVSLFVVHYARGRLHAHAGRWRDALASFKRALAAHQTAEAHYLIALAAYQLGYLKLAEQHTRRALAQDEQFAQALLLHGLLLRRLGDTVRARAYETQARVRLEEVDRAYNGRRRGQRYTEDYLLQTFFGVGAERAQLLTGGDERLATLLRTQAQS